MTCRKVSELILLPDWELLQAILPSANRITVYFNEKQKWQAFEFQNGTVAKSGLPAAKADPIPTTYGTAEACRRHAVHASCGTA